MSKLSKEEYRNNIQKIINEGMADAPAPVCGDIFTFRKYIASLLEPAHTDPKLMDFLIQWENILKANEDKGEYIYFQDFYNGLREFEYGQPAVKAVIKSMREILDSDGLTLQILHAIACIEDPVAQAAIGDAFNEYIADPNELTRRDVVEACWDENEKGNAFAARIITLISEADDYEYQDDYVPVTERYENINQRIAKNREAKKVAKTKAKLEAYVNSVFENAEANMRKEQEKNTFNYIVNNSGINLQEAIKTIVDSDANKNKRLMGIVEQYAGALNAGLYPERLFETFVRNVTPFNYLLPVEKAINSLNEAVKKNPIGIEITKILEEMSESTSCNILPLIEEDCARFVNDPNPTNRMQLRNCLVSFANDPYVNAILEAINNDNSKETNTLSEKALSVADEIKLIREHAHTENIYSPVQYIKEKESVFYANGQYFVRKGQNIAKIGPDLINQLSENFTTLCKLVNDPAVKIYEDYIVLSGTDKVAKIYEGYAEINGTRESTKTLRDLQEMGIKYDYDTNFFIMCSCLLENFNRIAKIDFGRRIVLNENAGISADLYRLGNSIFINTVNEDTDRSTFYYNVNPLKCKNIINDHMGINVSNLFEALLPEQNKIIMKLNETQNEYIEAIERYEQTIEKFKKAKEGTTNETALEKIEAGLKKAEDKLKELKDEYKKWQKSVDDETSAKEADSEDVVKDDEVNGDGDVKKETTNEPLSDSDVENAMGDLTTPITTEGEETAAEDGEDFNDVESDETDEFKVSDEEFDSFLNGKDETETEETEDDEEITDFTTDDEDDSKIVNITSETTDDTDDDSEAIADYGFGSGAGFEEFDAAFGEDEVEGESDDLGDEEIVDTHNAEDIHDEEDIIIDDEPTPEVDDIDAEEGDEATGLFGGDVKDPLAGLNAENDSVDANPMLAKIAGITFDQNVKTFETYKTGTVTAIVPMVNAEGGVYNDSKSYTFYLNDAGEPVIDNEDMPYSLYTTIVDNIKAHPMYVDVVNNGISTEKPEAKPASMADMKSDAEIDAYAQDVLDNLGDTEEESDPSGIEDFFDVIDTDKAFAITPKEETDDFADIPTVEDFIDDRDEEAEKLPDPDHVEDDNTVVIPTYKIGDTEVELPVPDADGTAIPESKKAKTSKKPVNEHRKSILGIGALHKSSKKGTDFFVNEDTVKSSSLTRYGRKLASEKIDGSADSKKGVMLENYDLEQDIDSLQAMLNYARSSAARANKISGDEFVITEISDYLPDADEFNAYKFNIVKTNSFNKESYTVYGTESGFYVRPTEEFNAICTDFEDEVPTQTTCGLEAPYTDETEEPIYLGAGINTEDWKFGIDSVIKTMVTPMPEELTERVKIRKFGLSPNHKLLDTKMVDDILHGDEEERDFAEEVEKDTQAAGVENPLAPSQPAQEEAFVPQLPNIHRTMSITEMKAKYDIVYEPNDKVIYNKEKATVVSVSEDNDSVNIMGPNGKTFNVKAKDLEPDPEYVNDLNILPDEPLINPDTPLKNEKPVKMKDLNAKNVECNIIVDRQKINMTPCLAPVKQIKESKKVITVVNEDGNAADYDVNNIEFIEKPYAVIVDGEGAPVRKIQIDPTSYINAADDELVKCYVAGKETAFPKKVINILS